MAPPLLLRIVLLAALPVAALAAATALLPQGRAGWAVLAAAAVASLVMGLAAGYRIIDRSAHGFLHPSSYGQGESGGTLLGALLWVVLYFVFAAVLVGVLLLSGGNQLLFWISWAVLFVFAAPAAVLRLVANRSLGGALNPLGIADTIVAIGPAYIGLCALILVGETLRSYLLPTLAGGGTLATVWGRAGAGDLGAGLNAALLAGMFAACAVYWYLSFALCALLGYAAYQYAEALDIVVVGPGDRVNGGRASTGHLDLKRRRRDALVAKLVADGDLPLAIEQINDELRERPNDLSLHARLHKLLLQEGNAARIENHSERCIDLFMRTDNVIEAVPLLADVIRRNRHWRPRDAALVVPLARAALELREPEVAVHLIRGFDKRFPRHPELPTVYVIGALAMLQTGGTADEAAALLEHVAVSFPEHPAAAEAVRYLQRLPDGGTGSTADPAAAGAGKNASV